MLATFNGTAFHLSYNIVSVYLLIVSLGMLRSNIFGRVIAYVGILAAILNRGLYVPEIGLPISVLSVIPFMVIWNTLVARGLEQLGSGGSKADIRLHRS